jgi:hypothetical protein
LEDGLQTEKWLVNGALPKQHCSAVERATSSSMDTYCQIDPDPTTAVPAADINMHAAA